MSRSCDDTLEVSVSFKFCLIHTQFVKRQVPLGPSIGKQNVQALKEACFMICVTGWLFFQ